MAKKDEKNEKSPKPNLPPQNVAELPSRCPVCNKKASRINFCDEHFLWFKEGLINRQGEKPKDFDKKYQLFMRKKAA